jgi:hypothetical protein
LACWRGPATIYPPGQPTDIYNAYHYATVNNRKYKLMVHAFFKREFNENNTDLAGLENRN